MEPDKILWSPIDRHVPDTVSRDRDLDYWGLKLKRPDILMSAERALATDRKTVGLLFFDNGNDAAE